MRVKKNKACSGHHMEFKKLCPPCEHGWFSGRILACHAGGPGSIPGPCN